jgi:hypothetical protein
MAFLLSTCPPNRGKPIQFRYQLEPSEPSARRVRDVISLLEEYGGFA